MAFLTVGAPEVRELVSNVREIKGQTEGLLGVRSD
jgi:hypothetical protein